MGTIPKVAYKRTKSFFCVPLFCYSLVINTTPEIKLKFLNELRRTNSSTSQCIRLITLHPPVKLMSVSVPQRGAGIKKKRT